MGIQDRDYYRNEGPSIFDSVMPRGMVCRWLIGINFVIFTLQVIATRYDDQVTRWLILDVEDVLNGQVWRLLTSAFVHSTSNFFHVIFNMIFLWIFGSDIEERYGRKEFLAVYLVSALLGGITFEMWGLPQIGPNLPRMQGLGASGAVTTMLILCALHDPKRMVSFFMLMPIPIWIFAVFNVLRDFVGFLGVGDKSVAFCVHLAGAGFAVAYFKWQGRITDYLPGWSWWKSPRSRVRLKLFDPDQDREEPVAVSANSAPAVAMNEHLEAKLDAILEKIEKTGRGSLTPKEEEVLRQASEMYKRRRT